MSNSNPPVSPAPAAPTDPAAPAVSPAPAAPTDPAAPAVSPAPAAPYPLANKWVMVLISVVALAAVAVWGVCLVNSIPLVSELPEGVKSPLEYVLQEAAVSFALPVAILGFAGAILSLVALVTDDLKLWLEFVIKLFALCAIIYTSSLVFAAANL